MHFLQSSDVRIPEMPGSVYFGWAVASTWLRQGLPGLRDSPAEPTGQHLGAFPSVLLNRREERTASLA